MVMGISPREYWKRMNYYDGLLYCGLLSVGGYDNWRITEDVEELIISEKYIRIILPREKIWYRIDVDIYDMDRLIGGNECWVIPVRDIN